jgi:hypothetical protein
MAAVVTQSSLALRAKWAPTACRAASAANVTAPCLPAVEPEPVTAADAGGPSVDDACEPANSCDQKQLNSSCQEYGAMTPPGNVESACVGGTYAAQGCERTDSFGGCQALSGTDCLTIWYFAPNFTSIEQVQQQCLDNGRVYVAP